ncbi:MAG: penicillin acylase family protein [Paracoccaceae bacterium]|nr:penicillin acylase family protein [Paracoccaceae bacterium]
MLLVFRWLLRISLALVALTGLGLTIAYWFFVRSLPDYDERFTAPGLTAPVEIVRDNANVPHIFAAKDADAFFALGVAHAQDRLWQMLMLRRAVQGRLSELFGPETRDTDELFRRLDLYTAAVRSVPDQTPEARAALAAYASGVNAWLTAINEGARGRGAPEFWFFSPEISPWQPADSIALVKLMALDLSPHLSHEILRARLSLVLPAERVADLIPDVPGAGVAALPRYSALVPGVEAGTDYAALPWPVPHPQRPGASNAWAAAPSRSAAGATLLASDPHLGFTAPAIWYLARIELETGGVIGGTIPGIPAVLAGRSARLGWGLTAAYVDDQDIFIEELNPENPGEVRTPDGWVRMRTRPSILTIAGAPPETLELRWTPNGPVLPERFEAIDRITPGGHVASLSWTALSEDDTTYSAVLGFMTAGDIDTALSASEAIVAPALNLVIADRERIAMKVVGALPERGLNHQSAGRLPVPGWRAQNLWQGTFPPGANPVFVDPVGGIVANSNNKPVNRPFPRHLSFYWGDTQRIQRLTRLMQSREVHTRESFIEAQLDAVSPTARALLPLIARDLWFTGAAAPEGTSERRRQRALDLMAGWNGEMNEHFPEPLLYAAWVRAVQARLIRDELGPMAADFTQVEPVFIERVFRDIEGASVWCDVIQSAPVETCAEIASLALDDALLFIDETWGSNYESLRWGDAHEAAHDHPVLGRVPGLNWVVNIRQSTSGGDNTLLRGQTAGTGPNPFLSTHGAGYRGVYDFADPDSSVFIIATGQSGHPLSRHYDDMGELWRRGEYVPMSLDPELARAAAVGVTRLEPR